MKLIQRLLQTELNKPKLSLRLPKELLKRLHVMFSVESRFGIGKSDIIENALREYLDKEGY